MGKGQDRGGGGNVGPLALTLSADLPPNTDRLSAAPTFGLTDGAGGVAELEWDSRYTWTGSLLLTLCADAAGYVV